MRDRAQAATEIIAIAVVMLAMFLTISLIMTQRNIHTNRVYALEQDRLECGSIGATITNFNSNKGYSQTRMNVLEQDATIQNGGIYVGEASCQYNGEALKETGDSVFVDDATGFQLERGKAYIVRKVETGVAFCDSAEEAWC